MFIASYFVHELIFKKPAKTSRQTLQTHTTYIIKLLNQLNGKVTYGEAAPLKGLSIDDLPDFETVLTSYCNNFNNNPLSTQHHDVFLPSIDFAFDAAIKAQSLAAPFEYFNNSFFNQTPILINGLVWMNDSETMLNEAILKAQNGFEVMKFKVGALDFDEECRMIEQFRKKFPYHIIRLDANGAFNDADALIQLNELARFNIHSIEQPIKAGLPDALEELCAKSKIPIALDEELIGIDVFTQADKLLKKIKPAFVILKPTLLGSFNRLNFWVDLAQQNNLGWWATSALESNIGLNIIAQWCATKNNLLPQGLGTGSLYENNFISPLKINAGKLHYQKNHEWKIPF